MIRHLWSVLCRKSVVDRESNSLSLFDVLEEITLSKPINEAGTAPLHFHLVTAWRREILSDPTIANARVRLVLPDGTEPRQPSVFRVDLSTFERLRHRLAFQGLPIRCVGANEFVVEVEGDDGVWTTVARIPLDVKVRVPEVGNTAAET